MAHQVFVYGTLKKGQPNHHVLTQCEGGKYTFWGQGRTVSKWPLVVASAYNIPFLLDIEGEGHNIVGEVYEVNDTLFAALDDLEGYPGFYDRRPISIKMEQKMEGVNCADVIECWLYIITCYKPFMRELETYENYDSNGSHGKQYVSRCDRDEGWADLILPSLITLNDDLKARNE
nr:putative gamma-glutamylcyclotransferase CG2811 isoform X2 [Lytechinus pictus]